MSNEAAATQEPLHPAYQVRGSYLHFARPDGKEHAIGTYESPAQLRREAEYNLAAAAYIEGIRRA